ncbi:hypothetical protein Nepgr_029588 [Nepenthes gracilis]|uniref:Sirohydrochlorin ferrochelatase n=1 Tax=Nepenthes gracilis TaxID=150966 RepID=A0AAD3TDV6_NEPGR|nr:hypothetical protein Nepgr_029588 [Nepenthes gracilis]
MSFGLLPRCLITSQIGSLPNADPKFAKFPKRFCQGNLLPPKVCFAMEHSKETCAVGKNDGVIIVDHGSRREESNLMLHEFVAKFKAKTGYQIVEPAHMELAEPSIKDAFGSCVHQGAGRVIINPFFLFPGRHWQQDIPLLANEAAMEHPGVPYIVTAPLGLHELLVDIVNDRIKYCLGHVAGYEDECSICAGTGRCQLISAS